MRVDHYLIGGVLWFLGLAFLVAYYFLSLIAKRKQAPATAVETSGAIWRLQQSVRIVGCLLVMGAVAVLVIGSIDF